MRKDWMTFFMDLAFVWADQSTCIRRQVGAVAVYDKRVLASGFNGANSRYKHCSEVGCFRQTNNIPSGQMLELCRAVHAEQNLILQAATYGISLVGTDIYCTTMPCSTCLKLLFGLKVKTIYFVGNYDFKSIENTIKDENNKRLSDYNTKLVQLEKHYNEWKVIKEF